MRPTEQSQQVSLFVEGALFLGICGLWLMYWVALP
jgi:hypothetical protein